MIFFTRLSLGFLRSACFGRSSPWAAADQEISRGDYKAYNIADLGRGCWTQSSSTWPHLAQGPTLLCFGVLHLSSSDWSCKFGSSINVTWDHFVARSFSFFCLSVFSIMNVKCLRRRYITTCSEILAPVRSWPSVCSSSSSHRYWAGRNLLWCW